jgi:hypothetical protein
MPDDQAQSQAAYVEQCRQADTIANGRSIYAGSLALLRLLQVAGWIGAVVGGIVGMWWLVAVAVVVHVLVEVRVVLCDISASLLRR